MPIPMQQHRVMTGTFDTSPLSRRRFSAEKCQSVSSQRRRHVPSTFLGTGLVFWVMVLIKIIVILVPVWMHQNHLHNPILIKPSSLPGYKQTTPHCWKGGDILHGLCTFTTCTVGRKLAVHVHSGFWGPLRSKARHHHKVRVQRVARPPPVALKLQLWYKSRKLFGGLRQSSKVFMRLGAHTKELEVRTICDLTLAVGYQATHYTNQEDLVWSTRAILKLAQWLREDSKLLESVYPEMKSNRHIATLTQIHHLKTVNGVIRNSIPKPIPVSLTSRDTNLVLGMLLIRAVIRDPRMAMVWNELADWPYQMGQRGSDQAGQRDNQSDLSKEERRAVDTIVPMLGETQRMLVMGVVSQINLKDSYLAGHEFKKWDFMRRELHETGVLEGLHDSTIKQLLAIWQPAFMRVYTYYDLSAQVYFKYVTRAGSVTLPATTSVTLRMLNLSVSHTLELNEVFQLGLINTPRAQWKGIIPQLYHPVPIVKQNVRISEIFPDLLFPTFVGRLATVAHTSQTVTGIFAGTVLKCSQGFEGGPGNMEMVSTQAKRIEVLKKKSVAAIKQVTISVGELRHMALLWDELRPGILILYSSEGKRQIRRFQEKAAKLAGKKSFSVQVERDLLVAKNNIILGNLYELDQVAAISRAAPETPHNEQVERKNRKFASTMLDRFRNPADLAASSKSWTPLRQLQQQLVARADKRNFALKASQRYLNI